MVPINTGSLRVKYGVPEVEPGSSPYKYIFLHKNTEKLQIDHIVLFKSEHT